VIEVEHDRDVAAEFVRVFDRARCKVAADEWERFPNLRANVLVPGSINSPQRIKTHPGETAAERKDMADITPDFVWWASEQSKGRSGEIVYL